jgi:threonine dehydrogenase-like Zn-dependent dehydrogenase
MRALVLKDQLSFDPDYPAPAPAPGEAIVRVTRAGICNTDLELVKGYMGFRGIPGHEFVGVLEETGERVVAEINCVGPGSPSRDWRERSQDPGRDTLGIDRRDGAFAEWVRVPLANLHRVPGAVSDDEAAFVEPLAAACQILEQVPIRPTDRARVLGDGKLGLLCAQVLATTGCDLLALGKHPDKLAILERRGIRTALAADWSGARDADVVVEATGSPAGFDLARRMLRPRGTLVLKSTFAGLTPADLTGVVVDEIAVIGSRCGPFDAALRLLERKQVDVLPLICARYPLEQGLQAFARARAPGALKVLMDISPF